ncbi:hypothetical protein [uncultured Polaribacter sp.]|uniref:hypothetical protein n=1 Tax=uncultured Polaribacter sp. TaxID=174711 RepID=UPI00261DDF92|nr:hypothetical protein [uncultured Polaribacter sp.]
MKPLPSHYIFNELTFYPHRNNKGVINYYFAEDDLKLMHFIYPNEYRIKNSLHKAYELLIGKSDNNHSYFGYAELLTIVGYLEKKYKLNLSKTYIRKIELGVNIKVLNDAMIYIDRLKSYQHRKEATKMMSRTSKHYGKQVDLSQQRFKLYHKSSPLLPYKLATEDNLIRFEMVFKKIVTINKYASTLERLINPKNFNDLVTLLQKKFDALQFENTHNLSNLTSAELTLYHAGNSTRYWQQYYKSKNKHTYATKKQRYNKIIKQLELETSNQDELIIELKSKIKQALEKQKASACYIP